MNTLPRLAIAALMASLVPPAVLSAYGTIASGGVPSGLLFIAAAAWIVGFVHIIFVGLPAFVYFLRRGTLSLRRIAVTGFAAGLVSNAFISFPRKLEGFSSGQNWHGKYVDLYVNGQPTHYAWLNFVESCIYMGIYGLLTAAVAWFAWQATSEQRASMDV